MGVLMILLLNRIKNLLEYFAEDEELEEVPEAVGVLVQWLVRSGVVGVEVLGVDAFEEDLKREVGASGAGVVEDLAKGVESLSVG
ncbi:hypothetical protein HK097_003641 [Rhizophlyctis rosea]|uniref:Uncharacterized protein n=1 Tax=Rhizophlyctis rosea TaxID=64517 RepID=A0AAD5S2N0_9FUNG|nr:hypothetical protein HK097_003641 [Rhizophlyctis rosea]